MPSEVKVLFGRIHHIHGRFSWERFVIRRGVTFLLLLTWLLHMLRVQSNMKSIFNLEGDFALIFILSWRILHFLKYVSLLNLQKKKKKSGMLVGNSYPESSLVLADGCTQKVFSLNKGSSLHLPTLPSPGQVCPSHHSSWVGYRKPSVPPAQVTRCAISSGVCHQLSPPPAQSHSRAQGAPCSTMQHSSAETCCDIQFLVHSQFEGCHAVFGLRPSFMDGQNGKVTQGIGVETESLLKNEHFASALCCQKEQQTWAKVNRGGEQEEMAWAIGPI